MEGRNSSILIIHQAAVYTEQGYTSQVPFLWLVDMRPYHSVYIDVSKLKDTLLNSNGILLLSMNLTEFDPNTLASCLAKELHFILLLSLNIYYILQQCVERFR